MTFIFDGVTPKHADRVEQIARATSERLVDWFGPYSQAPLAVIVTAWNTPPPESRPGVVVVQTGWIPFDRDVSLERAVIVAIAEQYWSAMLRSRTDFREGLRLYSSARLIGALLEGQNFYTYRVFAGAVRYPVRSQQLSRSPTDSRPPVTRYEEFGSPAPEAERIALVLHTLERLIGWPAMQQALVTFLQRSAGKDPALSDFATVLSEQRGDDFRGYLSEASDLGRTFDNAIEAISSDLVGSDGMKFHTAVRVHCGDRSAAALRLVPVAVQFEDGTTMREWCDERRTRLDLEYESAFPAAGASVDPDVALLLDADRSNNARFIQARLPRSAARVVLNWLVWLQDMMLTYTSLV